jgi:alpha-L-fucosidase
MEIWRQRVTTWVISNVWIESIRLTMPTRRDFFRASLGAAAVVAVPHVPETPGRTNQTPRYLVDRPLVQLQQEFVDLRFGMFIHFNMATFQDREWGDPKDSPSVFNPSNLDTEQWARAAESARMTWGCLTTKHHDGFCIWPTATGVASVKDTSHQRDVVKAYVNSFRSHGLKVALYYSILDLRNDIRHFNVTRDKIELIKTQLTELLTNYGEITLLIFDGWDAPWSRITYEEVPFHEIYELVKKLQPNCLISELNASQYPSSALYYTDIKAFEQNAGQMVPGDSRIPALSCVTLTDGWFWKQADKDAKLKQVKQVVEEWLIPLNKIHCNLILNAAPNREGKLAPNVVNRLDEIGRAWQHPGPNSKIDENVVITTKNLATGRKILASDSPDTVGPDLANDGNFHSAFYLPEGQRTGWLEIDLGSPKDFNTMVLVEPVGQSEGYKESRIKSYRFQQWSHGGWHDLAAANLPSRVQIHRIRRISAQRVRLLLDGSGDMPHIAEIGLYNEPREVE